MRSDDVQNNLYSRVYDICNSMTDDVCNSRVNANYNSIGDMCVRERNYIIDEKQGFRYYQYHHNRHGCIRTFIWIIYH